MKVNFVIHAVLISVICVLLALVQYYYTNLQRLTAVRLYEPLFEDLIPSDLNRYYYGSANNFKYEKSRHEIPPSNHNYQATDSEVDNCIKAAIAFKLAGKTTKAMKLFEHAVAIAPKNADVLNFFGEYLEQEHEDIITADELYYKALVYSPDHQGALMNRERTSDVVDQMDLVMFSVIDEKRDLLKEKLHSTLDFETKKQVFYLHIYHTVGIEGNTMTISQLQYLLETGNAVAGKSLVEHNEILGLQLALKYLKLLTGNHYIGIKEILEIHKRVMGHVDPISSGIFRDQQVFVGSHIPPPPEDLPRLMDNYVYWLNSEEAQSMHPVRYAALAHYKLVDIHPFTDGNGRTSRLIMNLILLRSGYPPVIIYKEDRQKYYDYLTKANHGDVRPFVRFIAYCTDETLNTYLGLNNKLQQIADNSGSSPVIKIDANQGD